ncbi:MAG: 2-C-methyl-D-erythritol 4-phosphate cytidylyltransferase [Elusimicrobiales bacterium]|nr:2-C-methyl-D-erythritol 4-phosphate cytidylyltransferase [Elusimicrobiales bacterium]
MAKSENAKKPKAAALILAGGAGKRMGGDKQYMLIGGRPVLERTADVFLNSGLFSEIIIALSPENASRHGSRWASLGVKIAPAGATRTASLMNAFALVSSDIEIVAVHDGARPFVTSDIITECLEKAGSHGAAVPAVPLKDTVKVISRETGCFESTPDRSALMAVQTPQCYRRGILEKILSIASDGKDYSDESQILEQLGIKPACVKSDYRNMKITTPEDIAIAEALISSENEKTSVKRMPVCRSGFGYDVHRLVAGRPLKMAGVSIEHDKGLLGHSDGDVVLHAVCDALLGSIGAGEIGIFFPPTNKAILGIDSIRIAEKTMAVLRENNARIVNIDVTIVAEEPKMKPLYSVLRESLAKIFEIPLQDISVKAKTHEALDAVGERLAIECYAAVSVVK